MKIAKSKFLGIKAGILFLALLFPAGVFGQGAAQSVSPPADSATNDPRPVDSEDETQIAPVNIDGRNLFRVRGIVSYPAEKRAADIRQRILNLARDPAFDPSSITIQESPDGTDIMAGAVKILTILDIDANVEGVSSPIFAKVVNGKIQEAIVNYRYERRPEVRTRNILYALGATALIVGLFFLFRRLFGRLNRFAKRRFEERVRCLKVGSFEVVRAERIRGGLSALLSLLRWSAYLLLFYLYLDFVLSRYPSTRPFSTALIQLLLEPLKTIGQAFLDYLPSLAFLVVLIFLAVYGLKIIKLFFTGLAEGTIPVSGFDREWAKPTYNLVRVVVIVFVLVVAYPHIPGSGSEAFKGVSIFLGIMFSLGSTSAVSNIIAGYTMIYRRAFKVGDRIQVGEFTGDVTAVRLLTTQLRTIKNEVVVIPNSVILNSQVVNYSILAPTEGLILHTTVGIGYETSWRQVEAMLIAAAERTPQLLKNPPPFVLQKNLGDFAVSYEINAYCQDSHGLAKIYAELHRNILDQFNEYGVQIMTPAYEGDPEKPKVVSKDKWFESPARKPPAG